MERIRNPWEAKQTGKAGDFEFSKWSLVHLLDAATGKRDLSFLL